MSKKVSDNSRMSDDTALLDYEESDSEESDGEDEEIDQENADNLLAKILAKHN